MILESFALSGKVALVTGASSGIGRGIALAMAEAGADVMLASRRRPVLEEVAQQARALGRRALVFAADLTDLKQITRMVDVTVADLGRIDVLENAAGAAVRKPTVELTESDFDHIYDINIKSVTFACASAGRHFLRQRSGKVINIASLTTLLGFPGRALYGPTKGAVGQLTKSLATEWGPYGICVNAIAPGWIETDLSRPALQDPEFMRRVLLRTPLGRIGQPEDIGATAVFLASSASDFVTGQIVVVDGGYSSA